MKKPIELKGKNIYPFSRENFDAIINYYFISNGISDAGPNNLNKVFDEAIKVELFEFEFIIDCIFQHIAVFEDNLNGRFGLSISNLCQYGLDAFKGCTDVGSKERSRITKLFYDQMLNTSMS